MAFIDTPITYEQLQSGQFLSRSIPLTSSDDDSGTSATLFVEISVNCAGSGRGIRVTDPGEACDDGNQASCGTCDAKCTEDVDGPGCAGGTGCDIGDDCASGTCVTLPLGGRVCTAACGNGRVEGNEVCDDNDVLACGTCNAGCTFVNANPTGCALGTECLFNADCASANCVDRKCAPRCGNGTQEGTEACDDGNTLTCGRCDPTCEAVNSPVLGCGAGVHCAAPADCASNNCVSGTCQ